MMQIKTPTECEPYVKPYYYTAGAVSPVSPSPIASPMPPPTPTPEPTTPKPPTTTPTSTPAQGDGSPLPTPPASDSSSGVSIGVIIGAVVGGIAVVAILAGIIVVRRKKKAEADDKMESGGAPAPVYEYTGPADYRFASVPPPNNGVNGVGATTAAAAAAGGVVAVGAAGYMSNTTGSQPTTPGSELMGPGGLSTRRSSNGLSADPLMQYITSTFSSASGASRGPLSAWQLRFEDIKIEQPIGEGSWGRVYKGNWQQTEVAVKILLDGEAPNAANTQSALMATNSPIMGRLEQEASIMSHLTHPNIVQFLGLTLYPASIVTEYCSRGSLTAVLSSAAASPELAAELTWSR